MIRTYLDFLGSPIWFQPHISSNKWFYRVHARSCAIYCVGIN